MIVSSGVEEDLVSMQGPWYYASVKIREKNAVVNWCLDNFGIDGRHNWVYSISRETYFFRNEEDFVLFVLRWS